MSATAGGGEDHIYGEGGADVLYGDGASDWISGGAGDDEIYSGDGAGGADGKSYMLGGDGNHV